MPHYLTNVSFDLKRPLTKESDFEARIACKFILKLIKVKRRLHRLAKLDRLIRKVRLRSSFERKKKKMLSAATYTSS